MYICHHCACTTITVISGCARVVGGLWDVDDDILPILRLLLRLHVRTPPLFLLFILSSSQDEHQRTWREAPETRLVVAGDASAWGPVPVVEVPESGVRLAAPRTWWLQGSEVHLLRRHICLDCRSLTRKRRRNRWHHSPYSARQSSPCIGYQKLQNTVDISPKFAALC